MTACFRAILLKDLHQLKNDLMYIMKRTHQIEILSCDWNFMDKPFLYVYFDFKGWKSISLGQKTHDDKSSIFKEDSQVSWCWNWQPAKIWRAYF